MNKLARTYDARKICESMSKPQSLSPEDELKKQQKKKVPFLKKYLESLPGEILNYSFKELTDLDNLVEIEPRRGKRKIQDWDLEAIDNQDSPAKNETKHNAEKLASTTKFVSYDRSNAKDKLSRIIDRENKPFGSNTAKQKVEVEKSSRMQLKTFTPGINLSNNLLGHGEALGRMAPIMPAIEMVVSDPMLHVMSIDLSFNYIRVIPEDIGKLTNLTSLYLHRNMVSNLAELLKLHQCEGLKFLTLHNNPVEEIDHYRYRVICFLPNLKKLDTAVVSPTERGVAENWASMSVKGSSLAIIKKEAAKDIIEQYNYQINM